MLGGVSVWQLLIVLLIVVMIFGTKKLRNMGGDLGGAVRSFKKAMNEDGKVGDGNDTTDSSKPIEHKQQAEDAQFSKTAEQEKQ